MLEFLGLLLALVLALSPSAQGPNVASEDIIAKIEENISHVEASQGKALEYTTQGLTPEEGLGEASPEGVVPNTEKVLTYNLESERIVGEVPLVAVQNAPPLAPVGTETAPILTPTPIPTPPVIPLPDPEPIFDPPPGPCPYDSHGNPKILILCPLDF